MPGEKKKKKGVTIILLAYLKTKLLSKTQTKIWCVACLACLFGCKFNAEVSFVCPSPCKIE